MPSRPITGDITPLHDPEHVHLVNAIAFFGYPVVAGPVALLAGLWLWRPVVSLVRGGGMPDRAQGRAVLMHGVHVGAGAVVRNAVVDKFVAVPPGARLGVDPDEDRARGFVVEDGLTILGKDHPFPD